MHFSTIAIAALAALPSMVSAFRLGDISNPIGDVSDDCESQFNIPLMSCGRLPSKCSQACEQQLENLETTLQKVCRATKNAGGLLKVAMDGDLVDVLCEGDSDDDEESPLKPTNTQLSFSGTAQIQSTDAPEPSRTSLIVDTSVPTDVTQTQAFPGNTYAPTTMTTSTSGPQNTQGSSDNNNGGPFTSQEDGGNENSAAAIRAGLIGVAAGVFAVIANIA